MCHSAVLDGVIREGDYYQKILILSYIMPIIIGEGYEFLPIKALNEDSKNNWKD